jgi:hypothetical protein
MEWPSEQHEGDATLKNSTPNPKSTVGASLNRKINETSHITCQASSAQPLQQSAVSSLMASRTSSQALPSFGPQRQA